jgi:hypothetical protein
VLQLSVTVAAPKAAAIWAVVGLQGRADEAANVITGLWVSRVKLTDCVAVCVLPHASVTAQVLVTVFVQPVPVSAPVVPVAVKPVLQLSVTLAVPKTASI